MTTSKKTTVSSKGGKKVEKTTTAKTLNKADIPARIDRLPEPFNPADFEKYYGVYSAVVSDVKDPEDLGRVKVLLPWLDQGRIPAKFKQRGIWARPATLMAGNNRGSWFIPDVDDEVLVAFEGGDSRHPYVIGSLWNGNDLPPESMDSSGRNNRKVLKSRNGVKVTLDDTDGSESLILETPAGQRISLKDGNAIVTIEDSNGNSLELASSGITITASARVKINASVLEISASMVEINAGMTKASGVVKCDTLIANSVISASYTPGAGNVW